MFFHQIYVGILLSRRTHHIVDPKHKFAAEAASTDCCLPRLQDRLNAELFLVLRLRGRRLARARSDSRSVLKLQAPLAVVSGDTRLRFL